MAVITNNAITGISDTIEEDDLKISNAGSNGQFLQKQSGNTGGLTWATVDTSIADDAITQSKIADNAVGLAEMAHGTDGQIITYDANGAPIAVGPGTDGQVLTSTGAGSPPAFEDIAAGSTPAFCANTDSFSFVDATWSKINNWTEIYDSGGVFDTTNDRFTPGVAGKYLFGWHGTIGTGNANLEMQTLLYKNGSSISSSKRHGRGATGNHPEYPMSGGTVVESDTDDYFELWVWHNSGSGWTRYYNSAHFWAIKIA